MKSLLALLLIVMTFSGCGLKEKSYEDEIYAIVNEYIRTDRDFKYFENEKLDVKFLLSDELQRPDPFNEPLDIESDTLFSKGDIVYMAAQDKDTLPILLKAGKLKLPKLIKLVDIDTLQPPGGKKFWDAMHDKYGLVFIVTIGKPIFTKDHKTAILDVSCSGGGFSSSGSRIILRKDKGSWKVLKSIMIWIS
jgi:hypothetical protein